MITLSLTHRESYILEAMLRVAVETTANENLTAFNSTETSGSEASNAPTQLRRRAASEIATTSAAVADRIAEARRGEHTTSVTNKG
jgi:hypothetical protein